MDNFIKEELEEALRAINSTISKSEKVQLKLKAGTFQHTMTARGLKAYYISIELIKKELVTNIAEDSLESKYMKEELEEALQTIASVISRVEKVLPKFETGTSQHTLAVRRIKAFDIATELIKRELKKLIITSSSILVKPQVGGTIKFGKYDWRVLDVQGDKALLLADKVTQVNLPYNENYIGVTWETCTLRKWLNSEFLTQEFTPQEQGKIALSTIQNENNQWYSTKGGNDTSDKIFLLSIAEVVKYFGDSGQLINRPKKEASKRDATYINDKYNNERIADSISKGSIAWWWLRSPGIGNHAAFVNYDGWLLVHGYRVDNGNGRGGVRPALFVNL